MDRKVTIAKRESWKNLQPMPAKRVRLSYERSFTAVEFESIGRSLIPQVMEDKWFIFLEESWLYFHRGWTGFCIFQVRIEKQSDRFVVVEAWANRDGQNCLRDDDYDTSILAFLIGRLLLSEGLAFPETNSDDLKQSLLRHAVIGYGRSNQEKP